MFWVYILQCEDGSLYTGFTDDIKKRVRTHFFRLKGCAKYTKSHRVKDLVALWKCESETAARKLEYRIKRLERRKKLLLKEDPALVKAFFPELSDFEILPETKIKFADGLLKD